jgi:hypothetical protein
MGLEAKSRPADGATSGAPDEGRQNRKFCRATEGRLRSE